MGRIKEVDKGKGDFPYYVEMYNEGSKEWVSEVRYYAVMQDVRNFPDNVKRRNFKYIGPKT